MAGVKNLPCRLRVNAYGVRRTFKTKQNNSKMFIEDLNEAQQEAVLYNEGPHLVIAGAGSGKTRVLTYKIAYLLEQGVPAQHILALTFTNKAAREMKERINKLVGERTARYLWMGTFHSVCARILRQEAEAIGYTHDFTIYDTEDSKRVLKQIVKEMELDEKIYKLNTLLGRISDAKNAMVQSHEYSTVKGYIETDKALRMYRTADIYRVYQQRLRQANAMDFDDLLLNMNLLLQQSPETRQKYQDGFEYVLVDEYQDTNYSQCLLTKVLAAPKNKICVVGDDAQSIYSFRGADIQNILSFQSGYPNARLFKLERNYRSTQTIVNAANSLIQQNRNQIPKQVYSENGVGDRLQLSAHSSDRDEGKFIAEKVYRLHRMEHTDYDDIAVLYRTNAQSRTIEDAMRSMSIPYRIYGSVSFYQRREVKDALGYFRLAVNGRDDEALLRVINTPARGIGETTMRRVMETAHATGAPLLAVVAQPELYSLAVSAATQKKLREFAAMISQFAQQAEQMNAFEFAEHVMKITSLLSAALMDKTPEGQDRYENLQQLLGGIQEFCEIQMLNASPDTQVGIRDFLSEVALLTDQDEHTSDNEPRVTLMTVHAAKGLEFGTVFVAGMETNLFPSMFCESLKEMEEERRLFYVAITRAKERCFLTYAKSRFRNGEVCFCTPSIFLREIDGRYLSRTEEHTTMQQPHFGSRFVLEMGPSAAQYNGERTPQSSLTPLKSEHKAVSSEKEEIQTPFAVGTRIRHSVFGVGTVLATYRENENEKIDVAFDATGKKTLLLKFAKLTLA